MAGAKVWCNAFAELTFVVAMRLAFPRVEVHREAFVALASLRLGAFSILAAV